MEALWLRECSEACLKSLDLSRFACSPTMEGLGGRFVLVDLFMPLPEMSAVMHNRESGSSHASIAVIARGFAMRATQKASGEELQFADQSTSYA